MQGEEETRSREAREEEEAALRIQSIQRGKAARAEVAERRKTMLWEEEQRLREAREQEEAALRIQSIQRGKAARADVAERRKTMQRPLSIRERRLQEEEKRLKEEQEEEAAAVRIQAMRRGKQARADVQRMREERDPEWQREQWEQEQAALRIQSIHRGKQARADVQRQKEEKLREQRQAALIKQRQLAKAGSRQAYGKGSGQTTAPRTRNSLVNEVRYAQQKNLNVYLGSAESLNPSSANHPPSRSATPTSVSPVPDRASPSRSPKQSGAVFEREIEKRCVVLERQCQDANEQIETLTVELKVALRQIIDLRKSCEVKNGMRDQVLGHLKDLADRTKACESKLEPLESVAQDFKTLNNRVSNIAKQYSKGNSSSADSLNASPENLDPASSAVTAQRNRSIQNRLVNLEERMTANENLTTDCAKRLAAREPRMQEHLDKASQAMEQMKLQTRALNRDSKMQQDQISGLSRDLAILAENSQNAREDLMQSYYKKVSTMQKNALVTLEAQLSDKIAEEARVRSSCIAKVLDDIGNILETQPSTLRSGVEPNSGRLGRQVQMVNTNFNASGASMSFDEKPSSPPALIARQPPLGATQPQLEPEATWRTRGIKGPDAQLDFASRNNRWQSQKEYHIARLREEYDRLEVKGCTFHPQINPKPLNREREPPPWNTSDVPDANSRDGGSPARSQSPTPRIATPQPRRSRCDRTAEAAWRKQLRSTTPPAGLPSGTMPSQHSLGNQYSPGGPSSGRSVSPPLTMGLGGLPPVFSADTPPPVGPYAAPLVAAAVATNAAASPAYPLADQAGSSAEEAGGSEGLDNLPADQFGYQESSQKAERKSKEDREATSGNSGEQASLRRNGAEEVVNSARPVVGVTLPLADDEDSKKLKSRETPEIVVSLQFPEPQKSSKDDLLSSSASKDLNKSSKNSPQPSSDEAKAEQFGSRRSKRDKGDASPRPSRAEGEAEQFEAGRSKREKGDASPRPSRSEGEAERSGSRLSKRDQDDAAPQPSKGEAKAKQLASQKPKSRMAPPEDKKGGERSARSPRPSPRSSRQQVAD